MSLKIKINYKIEKTRLKCEPKLKDYLEEKKKISVCFPLYC